jgi:hypothetical protein
MVNVHYLYCSKYRNSVDLNYLTEILIIKATVITGGIINMPVRLAVCENSSMIAHKVLELHCTERLKL